jgi:cytochrome P450
MRSTTSTQELPCVNSPSAPFSLPAPFAVGVNTMALHTSTATWGPDALKFNPARWIQPCSTEEAKETIITPPRGTFIPWSSGPRVCPGQKMSQVEFVTVIATLFRRCTAKPAAMRGETEDEMKQQLLALMQDSQPILTLQMNRPNEVLLSWKRRNNCDV